MIRLAVILCILAGPAIAQSRWYTSEHSSTTIEAIDDDDCVAEITIRNRQTDYMPGLDGAVEVDGLVVLTRYWLNVDVLGAERYEFIPPEGFIAVPQEITVNDDQEGTVLICHWLGF